MPTQPSTQRECRALGRQRRRQISAAQRRKASHRLNKQLCYQLRAAHKIALYLHFDGEPDLLSCAFKLLARGKQLYVPLLQQSNGQSSMHFVSFKALSRARINRYGIVEPSRHATRINSKRLQAIVMPLTAYDETGTRVGMGAGYYDRNLSWRHKRRRWLGPRLIGAAWKCQAMNNMTRATWDTPLDALVNETEALNFRKKK